jgi:hypothetical protein
MFYSETDPLLGLNWRHPAVGFTKGGLSPPETSPCCPRQDRGGVGPEPVARWEDHGAAASAPGSRSASATASSSVSARPSAHARTKAASPKAARPSATADCRAQLALDGRQEPAGLRVVGIVIDAGGIQVGDLLAEVSLGGADRADPLCQRVEGIPREPRRVQDEALQDILAQPLRRPPSPASPFPWVVFHDVGKRVRAG